MNADIQAKIDAIKAPIQTAIEAADAIPALVDQVEAVKYNEGYIAGQASIVLPNPDDPAAQYTQGDMDKLADTVRAENDTEVSALKVESASLQVQVDELKAKLDAIPTDKLYSEEELQAKMSAGIQDSLTNFKAELRAKYGAQQGAESALETDFLKELDPVVVASV